VAARAKSRREAAGEAFGLLKCLGPVNGFQSQAQALIQVSKETGRLCLVVARARSGPRCGRLTEGPGNGEMRPVSASRVEVSLPGSFGGNNLTAMPTASFRPQRIFGCSFIVFLCIASEAVPVSTSFTYQGRLSDGAVPANGSYDFSFAIYDAPSVGNQVGSTLTNSAVLVSNGLFTVLLDFGPGAFAGDARWLEVGVRSGSNSFSILHPRQPITAAPYSLQALNATAAGAVAATNLVGIVSDGQLSTNVALLNSNPRFAGTVAAPSFSGSAVGMTNFGTALALNRLGSTNDIFIFDGDSRMSSPGWPDYAITNLFFAGRYSFWANYAVSGAGLNTGFANYSNLVVAHKPAAGQRAYLIEGYGIADLMSVDAASFYAQKLAYWQQARNDGFTVITTTLPPADDGYNTAVVWPRKLYSDFDQNRRKFNQMVRTSPMPDGVLDVDAEINDPYNFDQYFGDRLHFTSKAKVALGAYASRYLMTMGRSSFAEPASPLYPRWRTTFPLKTAAYLQSGVFTSPSLPGNDQGGVLGLYDTIVATPGSDRGFVERVPVGAGWTNITVKLLLATDTSQPSCFTLTMRACALNTNTLAALAGPGALHSVQAYSVWSIAYSNFAMATFSLSWSNDYSPRQLWTLFSDITGAGPLTNNVYVLNMEATGF